VGHCQEGEDYDRLLLTIDPATGDAQLMGNTSSNGHYLSAITFGRDGTLYGTTGESGANSRSLVVIDKNNGHITPTLQLGGYNGSAIAYNPLDGMIYHAATENYFAKIDPVTLQTTLITLSGFDNDSSVRSMVYDSTSNSFFLVVSDDWLQITPDMEMVRLNSSVNDDLKGLARRGGTFNGASVAFDVSDSVPTDNFAGVESFIVAPDLAITMSDSPDPVPTSDRLTYTIDVTNNGDLEAQAVVMTDTLPDGVLLVEAYSDNGSCSELGGIVTCPLGNIPGGTTVETTLVITTMATIQQITNTASVYMVDPNLDNNITSESSWVGAVELELTKIDTPDPARTGYPLTYLLTVVNNTVVPATGVRLTDTIPSEIGLIFGSAIPDQGSCAEADGVVTCDLGTIAGLSTVEIPLVVTPTLPQPVGKVYTVDDDDNILRGVDRNTGDTLFEVELTLEDGEIGEIVGGYAVAIDPTTGTLWGVVERDGWWLGYHRMLVTIDPETGETTLIGNLDTLGRRFMDITFGSDGTLYGVTGDEGHDPLRLFTINKNTAASTIQLFLGGNLHGLAYNPDDGLLYHVSALDEYGGDSNKFETIDPTTLVRTPIPLAGDTFYGVRGLAYSNNQDIFMLIQDDDDNLVRLTPDGNAVELGGMDHYPNGVELTDDILNKAWFTVNEPDLIEANNQAVAETQMLAPDLEITKSASVAVVSPGQEFSYTLVFTNSGEIDDVNVSIKDSVPVTLTNVSVISSGVPLIQLSGWPDFEWLAPVHRRGAGGYHHHDRPDHHLGGQLWPLHQHGRHHLSGHGAGLQQQQQQRCGHRPARA
jgi:uncharacterized repeat protein (TIGR01451 family)